MKLHIIRTAGTIIMTDYDNPNNNDREVATTTSTAAASSFNTIPETLIQKYKKMLNVGMPLNRVQQLAHAETGASPEEVVASCCSRISNDEEKKKTTTMMATPTTTSRNNTHLVFMVDNDTTGTAVRTATTAEEEKENYHDDYHTPIIGGSCDAAAAAAIKQDVFFTCLPNERQVSFPASNNSLTDLIRKMAQTVEKTTRFGVGDNTDNNDKKNGMIVNESTLYNALGALKGVQFARDEYNSTILANDNGNNVDGDGGANIKDQLKRELLHAKRCAFAEMSHSIGITLPDSTADETTPSSINHHKIQSTVDIDGLDDLILHIETTNQREIERGLSLLKNGRYDFNSLHTLYPPGSHVIAKHAGGGGIDCICQVVWNRYSQGRTIMGKPMKYFQLCVRYIVPVGGGTAAFAEVVEGMEMFEGQRSFSLVVVGGAAGVGSLAFVPILEPQDLERILQQYALRGEKYNRMFSLDGKEQEKTFSYMSYEKGSFFMKCGGSFNAKNSSAAMASSGRIIVDFDGASENGHSISAGRDDLLGGFHLISKEYKLHLSMKKYKHQSAVDGRRNKVSDSVPAGSMILFSKIPAEYMAMVWPFMIGFSLTAKSWGDIIIDGLRDIIFDPDVFSRLVLPKSRKIMIKALVKHTCCAEGGFRDLVEGKGEGTVFLLYGEAGVGKTLTAEAVAEDLRRPLFSISMGTLGTTANDLERQLGEILSLTKRWDAIVLLDEADSFLEARNSNSPLERNAMVSVMLRLVEYHQGILFFTSNRIESLDPAFQTRISLALHYDALDLEGRAQVWESLLVKSGYGSSLGAIDVKELAKPMLNGREIKNALRLAMALAAEHGNHLSQDLLLEAADIVNEYKASVSTGIGIREKLKACSCIWSFWR